MLVTTREKALKWSLRLWGITGLIIFTPLLISFLLQAPFLAEIGGALNWSIWNDVTCHNNVGHSRACHVPPMLFLIYVVWVVFVLRASTNPRQYLSFLGFTMWANAAHALIMAGQAFTDIDRYWSKFLTDIPYIGFIAIAIYFFRPSGDETGTEKVPIRRLDVS